MFESEGDVLQWILIAKELDMDVSRQRMRSSEFITSAWL